MDKIIEGDQINKDIKIISINIAGRLNDKIDEIKSYLKNQNSDILCLQETHTYTEYFRTIKYKFAHCKEYDLLCCSTSQSKRYKELKEINI